VRIAEIYRSVQGEGFLTGTESVFVRTSGCNLRCWFCDTPYTSWSPEGDDLAVSEVLERAASFDCRHVVVTGGEPMIHGELVPLAAGLRRAGRHITIETAGTLYLPVECDLMSISPKLAGSAPSEADHPTWHRRHVATRHAPHVMQKLVSQYKYQIKFVVDAPADCQEAQRYLDEMPQIDRSRVMLMPQGTTLEELAARAEWLEPYCRDHSLVYCPRRQIEWFGLVRGT